MFLMVFYTPGLFCLQSLVCLSFPWWQFFLWDWEKIFYPYSGPNSFFRFNLARNAETTYPTMLKYQIGNVNGTLDVRKQDLHIFVLNEEDLRSLPNNFNHRIYRVAHMYLNDFMRLFWGHWVTWNKKFQFQWKIHANTFKSQ